MDRSHIPQFPAFTQNYTSYPQFQAPESPAFSSGIKLEPQAPPSGLGFASSSSFDSIIASADHETLVRVRNSTYMRLWDQAQSFQATVTSKTKPPANRKGKASKGKGKGVKVSKATEVAEKAQEPEQDDGDEEDDVDETDDE